MIESIAGVILWTDNMEDMVRFYRDALGLKEHSRHKDFVAFAVSPGVRLSVGRHSQVQGKARDPFRVMVNLQVADIHAVYEELRRRGVVFLRPPEREHWGGWVATLQDPDGNILQLLQLRG
ncbi:MAG: VOC family protein [Dehalococcoidia bacterium]|nr:VOC family protein [Dehalococcoidia bacterium]MDW8119680.1 VOC family protein [Chloroflexota bacterium]